MDARKTAAEWVHVCGMTVEQLAKEAMLDRKVIEAILQGRYTTSPSQRQRIADALGIDPVRIAWSGPIPVDHMYGHGPQFGRSP